MSEREKSMESANSSDKLRRHSERPWAVMGVMALAVLLRFFALGKDSLWFDEVLSANISHGGLAAVFQASTTLDGMNFHPPLYHLILHFWMLVFGQSDPALRSLSAIFGTLSVLLVYKVGTELFDRKTGLVAALLLAVSPFAIYYSQEVRPYSLFMLLTLTSFLFFIRMLRPDRRHKADSLGYCTVNVLLLCTHAYGLFVIGSQVLYFLIFRKTYASSRRPFWIAQVLTALVASPWIYILLRGVFQISASHGILQIEDPLAQAFSVLLTDLLGFAAGAPASLLIPLSIALFLGGLFRLPRQGIKILGRKPKTALLLLWFFVPLVGVVIIALVSRTALWSKYLIGIAPAMYLIATRGMVNIGEAFRVYVAKVNVSYALLAIVALLCLPQVLTMQVNPGREQWREVADLIDQESLSDDVILCLGSYDTPFKYYYKGNLEVLTYGTSESDEELAALVDHATEGNARLWLIMMNYQGTIDAPIKGYLLARYGDTSILLQRDFSSSSVYLFVL